MKVTAQAPANIAFIKYWGKSDPITRIPQNDSISMCLSDLYSLCTVEFSSQLKEDKINFIEESVVKESEIVRIKKVLDRVRILSRKKEYAKVITKNNFPKATGIASSASGFAALSLASLSACGILLSEKDLSIFARQASGTASRSIPDGFVHWKKGSDSSSSYSYTLFEPSWWDIRDVVVIVTSDMKKVSSTEGHAIAHTSPFYRSRQNGISSKIISTIKTIKEKDFTMFGRIIEEDALNMHAICTTSTPSLLYWEPLTIKIMKNISVWREQGLESYFTIDAGPTVHIICQGKDETKLVEKLKNIEGIERIVVNKPARGAHLINKHLF